MYVGVRTRPRVCLCVCVCVLACVHSDVFRALWRQFGDEESLLLR